MPPSPPRWGLGGRDSAPKGAVCALFGAGLGPGFVTAGGVLLPSTSGGGLHETRWRERSRTPEAPNGDTKEHAIIKFHSELPQEMLAKDRQVWREPAMQLWRALQRSYKRATPMAKASIERRGSVIGYAVATYGRDLVTSEPRGKASSASRARARRRSRIPLTLCRCTTAARSELPQETMTLAASSGTRPRSSSGGPCRCPTRRGTPW